MADAIEAAGVIFQTGYFMRGQPVHQFLREQIQLGHFGQIHPGSPFELPQRLAGPLV
jgi:predicted dehydrogenase